MTRNEYRADFTGKLADELQKFSFKWEDPTNTDCVMLLCIVKSMRNLADELRKAHEAPATLPQGAPKRTPFNGNGQKVPAVPSLPQGSGPVKLQVKA